MEAKFFLGGRDREMEMIRHHLEISGVPFEDFKLEWGAKASAYKGEILSAIEGGIRPVLVELEVDFEIPGEYDIIDHHGALSANPASLLQVLERLGVTPTHYDKLVAANDSGYIPAMLAMGATTDEIEEIRLTDRKAQGVTQAMEVAALDAISKKRTIGPLVIIELPHTKCSTVTDRLFASWPDGKERLLVICQRSTAEPGPRFEVNHFGRGDVCKAMADEFEGWGGGRGYGNADAQGFAGCKTSFPEKVCDFVAGFYNK